MTSHDTIAPAGAQQSNLSSGWDVLYKQGENGKPTWSENPPPFIDEAKGLFFDSQRVIELCSGDGRNTKVFCSWGANLTALDISPTALDQLGKNFDLAGITRPITVVGSASDIPLGSGLFDLAVCIDGFPQLDRPRRAMEEVHRVLKPNGSFILNIFTPRDETYAKGEQIGPRAFLYHACLFQFYEAEDFEPLFAGLFAVANKSVTTWRDPAHGDFRPYPHKHEALLYQLKKLQT
jgi:ubiquinone/menaquinone biosynthesis C-methylase UbiE